MTTSRRSASPWSAPRPKPRWPIRSCRSPPPPPRGHRDRSLRVVDRQSAGRSHSRRLRDHRARHQARAAVEAELRSALSVLRATLDSTADGLIVVDEAGAISSINGRLADMWMLPESYWMNQPDQRTLSAVTDQLVHPEALMAKWRSSTSTPTWRRPTSSNSKNGHVSSSALQTTSRRRRGGRAGVELPRQHRTGASRVGVDISGLPRLPHRPRQPGTLRRSIEPGRGAHGTHAPSRRRHVLGPRQLQDRQRQSGALDRGRVVRAVADVLLGCIRQADTAARLGGDEFAVLIEHIDGHSDIVATGRADTRSLAPSRHARHDRGVATARSASPSGCRAAPASNCCAMRTSPCTWPRNTAKLLRGVPRPDAHGHRGAPRARSRPAAHDDRQRTRRPLPTHRRSRVR